MSDHFFKVCMVRRDGGVGETTFIGYVAERLAFTYASSLEDKKEILFVSVIQRIANPGIKWEVRLLWTAKLKENAKSAD